MTKQYLFGDTDLAAKLFSMNIQTWRHNAFAQENCSAASIRQLAEGLADLAADPTHEEGLECRLRQLVLERKD